MYRLVTLGVFGLLFPCVFCQGCGKRPALSRVVNGEDASPHSWPWQVSLRKDGYHICGGSLIRPNWIVTAAHCVHKDPNPMMYRVVVGAHRRLGIAAVEQHFRVKAINEHSGFDNENLKHDIAVIELRGSAKISDKVSTVCLPTKRPRPGTKCYVTGWGLLYGKGPVADTLQQGELPIVSDEECARKYTRYESHTHLCAGKGTSSSSVACHGDSGGPLVCEMGGTWYLHGAVSFGKKNCPSTHYTVFARITSYLSWIMEKIGDDAIGGEITSTPGTPPSRTPPAPDTSPTPTDSGCKDENPSYCAKYKRFCSYVQSFKKDCPKTCNIC